MFNPAATAITREWFDELEKVLHAQAELAGLLDHGTLIGDAREFFVTQVLRSVLPPALHVGSGRIVGRDGSYSNQIDVIVYDASYPVLEVQAGKGIYFVEGVVASIEVKSRIDSEKLNLALSNCASVSQLTGLVECSQKEGTTGPCSYIFGYQSDSTSVDTYANRIAAWRDSRDQGDCIRLPEVIVAGSIVGLSNRSPFKVSVTGALAEKLTLDNGGEARVLMGLWSVAHPFGWLLIHLLLATARRFSPEHTSAMNNYLPIVDYWKEEMEGRLSGMVADEE